MKLFGKILAPLRLAIRHRLHPSQLVVLSFALVILIGSVLLYLPVSTAPGSRIRYVDALFTAVSATCVTGLVVVDTGTVFSVFGQLVILGCIQIGGLGLMTFTTVFMASFGYRLAITDRIAIQESFHHTPMGKLGTLIKYIVIATLITEAIGALLLAVYWIVVERFESVGQTVYHAIFHSVSAFCNAGFSLYPDNMMGFQGDAVVQLITAALIIAGGLGFLVGLDIKEYLQQRLFHRYWSRAVRERVESIRPRARLSVHTRLVLISTLILLVIGTVSYYFLERRGAFSGMGFGTAWMNAFFCAVTPRTAGFNTIDYAQFGGPALLCTMVLMFIGANPGSCGGGIKTSTFGLLVAYSISRWRGYQRLHLFGRTVPQESIDKGAAVVVAAVALIIIASSALMLTETRGTTAAESQREMLGILFETISAFGTVGLSLGQTLILTDPGKLIVSAVMFIGRTGPLTLALAIRLKQRREHYRFAEENIMVG
ncbi:MAG TPA: TrkH family potassium uptake protein [Blastocatellia bacterium]|nr:TrkH family potassium uptake protein [Blastocatellia bacterium]